MTRPLVPALAGVAAIGLAIYQVTSSGTPEASFDSVADWLREGLSVTYLLVSIFALELGTRDGWASTTPTRMVQAGYGLIAVGIGTGMALRDDPDWFFVIAGPGLLLSTIGFVAIGWLAVRRKSLPLWAGVLAGVGGAFAIIMAEFGTSVLIGAFWCYIAARARES